METLDFNAEPVEYYFIDVDGEILLHSEDYTYMVLLAEAVNGKITVWLDKTREPDYYPLSAVYTLELMMNGYTKGLLH